MTAAERSRRLILFDAPNALVMLNRYPYNNGHLMIAPRRHIDSPEQLDPRERALLGDLVAYSVQALRRALHPDGFNLGANLGKVAGAGFAGHLHWHIVPRWNGDTNFMAAVASTRVLSQHLEDSYRALRPVFKAIKADLS
jgi:ATP adenylyltransferase